MTKMWNTLCTTSESGEWLDEQLIKLIYLSLRIDLTAFSHLTISACGWSCFASIFIHELEFGTNFGFHCFCFNYFTSMPTKIVRMRADCDVPWAVWVHPVVIELYVTVSLMGIFSAIGQLTSNQHLHNLFVSAGIYNSRIDYCALNSSIFSSSFPFLPWHWRHCAFAIRIHARWNCKNYAQNNTNNSRFQTTYTQEEKKKKELIRNESHTPQAWAHCFWRWLFDSAVGS